MKKFILMLFAVFMMFSLMTRADPVSAGYVESHAEVSDITPGLAIAGNIGMERTHFGDDYVNKETTSKPCSYMLADLIGGGSSNGVHGGGTIGAIRS